MRFFSFLGSSFNLLDDATPSNKKQTHSRADTTTQIPIPIPTNTESALIFFFSFSYYRGSRKKEKTRKTAAALKQRRRKNKMARRHQRRSRPALLAPAAAASALLLLATLLVSSTTTMTMAAPSSPSSPNAAPAPAESKGSTTTTSKTSSTLAIADADAVVGSSSSSSTSTSSSSSNPWPPEVVRALKKTVVNIDLATPVSLVDDKRTAATGTGFVVDAAAGLVVTNRHISTVSPTAYQVRFNDGSFAPARCVYYDVAQDFAVLKVDPGETTYNLTAVELGTAESLRVGDPVLIIGNNEGYVFSAIEGVVSDLRALSDTAGVRPSLDIETTFDSSSGSSGSPVW